MVLAAGLGTRLRPLTQSIPKALVKVGGRTLIDAALDRLAANGVDTAVVNTHHLADLIVEHLKERTRPRIRISHEPEILDTGGGIKKALPWLGPDPFYAVNAKVVWLGGSVEALLRLAEAWDGAHMDALLLLHPTVGVAAYDGRGDFRLDQLGRIQRRGEREVAPFLYTGIQMVHPRLFAGAPDGAFSMNWLFNRAISAGRLHGLRHDGEWFQVSTPGQLAEAEKRLGQALLSPAER